MRKSHRVIRVSFLSDFTTLHVNVILTLNFNEKLSRDHDSPGIIFSFAKRNDDESARETTWRNLQASRGKVP